MRVLIVDDDPVALMTLKALIEQLGHTVATRSEALGTSSAIREQKPELIVLDVHMPGLSGDALARLLQKPSNRERDDTPSVLFYSAMAERELEQLVASTGAAGYLSKDWTPQRVKSEFKRLASSQP